MSRYEVSKTSLFIEYKKLFKLKTVKLLAKLLHEIEEVTEKNSTFRFHCSSSKTAGVVKLKVFEEAFEIIFQWGRRFNSYESS